MMPPIDDAQARISISAVPKRSRVAGRSPACRANAPSTESPIGNSIAVVEVLFIHADATAASSVKPIRIRVGDAATAGFERIDQATRRSRPELTIALASTKPPRKSSTIGSPKPAKISVADPTPHTTRERRSEQRRHRDRHRLGDPPDHHPREDRGEPRGRGIRRGRRKQEQRGEEQRADDESDRPAHALEALLRLRQHLVRFACPRIIHARQGTARCRASCAGS